jgi:hypothetical protein
MSYEITKNINLKTRVVTSADSSLRPLTYRKWIYGQNLTEKEFIKNILFDIEEGNLHLQNNKNLFRFKYTIFKNRMDNEEKNKILADKIWNYYDYSKKELKYTLEEQKQAKEEYKENLYNIFINFKEEKGLYYIESKYNDIYFKTITTRSLKETSRKETAKTFDSYEKAFYFLKFNIECYNCFKKRYKITKAD